ncbi:MAG: flagellar basal body P-ring formation chaperone FlgA [Alphaproteobacteria bacterium]|nr:flagellar basal body P-ring formation chaperone FlgA [Alphaproteobacteria bacterium]
MSRTARLLFAAWLIVSGSVGSPSPCAADTAVTINPAVETRRLTVKLSDLFNNVPTEIDRAVAQSPLPCRSAVYDERVLDKLADTYRLDWQPASEGPHAGDHVTVTSSCARITADMVRDAVIARVKQDGNTRDRTFDVGFDTRNLEVDLPADQKPDFTLNNFTYDEGAKRFRADLTAQTSRGPYILPVAGRIEIKRSVPVLAHHLGSGTVIGEADLDWQQMPEDRVTADIITEEEQLVGRELRRDSGEGEMLRTHDIIPPRLVKRGALVTMRVATPNILVTAQGKAEQDGAVGETVRVLNTQSNRVVEGTVTGPDSVEIHTAQKLASAE